MRIKFKDEIDTLKGHFVIHGLSVAIEQGILPENTFEDVIKEKDQDDGHLDVAVTINGREIDIHEFCEYWEKQIDRMIREKAQEIVDHKFSDLSYLFDDLQGRINTEIEKRLEYWEREEKN